MNKIIGKILITGGAGFIGSHLVERLLSYKYKIIVVDNFNDYYNPELKKTNINHILNKKKHLNLDNSYFKIYDGDIRDKSLLDTIFEENKIDLVIHLAAMAGVRSSMEIPEEYISVNVNGTANILEACKKRDVKKFILASSSSVYGNNSKVPFSEDDPTDTPISPYAASKKAAELLAYTYYNSHNISTACLRFFSVYGPRQRPDLAIHKFTEMISNNEAIPFYGDGNTIRDYTYIDDIIEGIVKTIGWIDRDDKQFEIFNLGESQTVSLKKVVETLEKELGKKAIINSLPPQLGDINNTFADISKSKKVLGYEPKTDFETGIKKFVQWYLGNK